MSWLAIQAKMGAGSGDGESDGGGSTSERPAPGDRAAGVRRAVIVEIDHVRAVA